MCKFCTLVVHFSILRTAAKPVLPKLESSVLEDIYDEIELIGFPVTASMFDLAKSSYRGDVLARDLCAQEGRTVRMVGDFIAEKTTRTKNGTYMKFGTFLDVEDTFFDTVHFPPSLKAYPLRGNGLYLIEGRVMVDFGCPSIEVQKCGRMPMMADPRSE
jgi:DNA polymerase-3 subunit alpha